MTNHAAHLETVIRDLIADLDNLPVRAEFYRGPGMPREEAATPGCPRFWFVAVRPTALDVCVSAAGRYWLGANDVIGDVNEIRLPQTAPGVVDVTALTGPAFRDEIAAAIRRQAAVVQQMHANMTA